MNFLIESAGFSFIILHFHLEFFLWGHKIVGLPRGIINYLSLWMKISEVLVIASVTNNDQGLAWLEWLCQIYILIIDQTFVFLYYFFDPI